MTENLSNHKRNWEEQKLNPTLNRFPERKPEFTTTSEIEVERLYLPDENSVDGYLETQAN